MSRKSGKIYRLGRIYVHIIPVLVWLGALVCVVMLFRYRTQRFEILGIAQGHVRQITSTCSGRLQTIQVELFDKVKKGDTIALIDTVLDNENLQAQLAVISAEIEHLKAQLVPTKEQLIFDSDREKTNIIATQRRFNVDIENARLRLLELKTLIEVDRMALEGLDLDVKISKELVDEDAIAVYELQKAQNQYSITAKRIQENERLLMQAEKDLKQAAQRQEEFAQRQQQYPSVNSALKVIQKAIAVQEQRMDEIIARRQVLVLKSPIDGMVSMVLHGSGEAIVEGDPIVTVAEMEPSEIIAYVDEKQAGLIEERMPVKVMKSTNPAQISSSQVVNVGSTVEMMPQRLWRNPNIAQWGRPILIKIPPDFKLLPGELVWIKAL